MNLIKSYRVHQEDNQHKYNPWLVNGIHNTQKNIYQIKILILLIN